MNKLCILFWNLSFVDAINRFSCEELLKQEAGEMSRNGKILDIKNNPPRRQNDLHLFMLSGPRCTSCHKEFHYATAEQEDFPHISNNDFGARK